MRIVAICNIKSRIQKLNDVAQILPLDKKNNEVSVAVIFGDQAID
jgi:hypothetical protein